MVRKRSIEDAARSAAATARAARDSAKGEPDIAVALWGKSDASEGKPETELMAACK